MALTPKERERIIEEERVRFEAKQALWAEHCAKHPRRGRWLYALAAVVLAYAVWCHYACGGAGWRNCHHGYGMMGAPGKHCMHGGMHGGMEEAPDEPAAGQPIPKKP